MRKSQRVKCGKICGIFPHFTHRNRSPLTNRKRFLSFDTKLSVFTVQGSNEPRLVKLFLKPSCSCPSSTLCYHILAAKMSLGINEEAPKHPLNMTQLRRNKRKRGDKTSDRKQPRKNDVDVIPPYDANPDLSDALLRDIIGTDLPSTPEPMESSQMPTISQEICYTCSAASPHHEKTLVYDWIGCDKCPRWYHTSCIGLKGKATTANYKCQYCG